MAAEIFVQVAMRIEGGHKKRAGPDHGPNAPRSFGLGSWHAAHRHRPVKCQTPSNGPLAARGAIIRLVKDASASSLTHPEA
jgi:hypothetical protein